MLNVWILLDRPTVRAVFHGWTRFDRGVYMKGFTLIELLVVVLIIGILAAVALPQYQKAVEKSRSTQAITLLKSVYQAAQTYFIANGSWPTSFDDLAVEIPWTGTRQWSPYQTDTRSNADWSLQLYQWNNLRAVAVAKFDGSYAGGGFMIFQQGTTSSNNRYANSDELVCVERLSYTSLANQPGKFCSKLFGGTKTGGDSVLHIYTLP